MENTVKKLDQNKIVGTVLLDLSKTFSCIIHDLAIAKPNVMVNFDWSFPVYQKGFTSHWAQHLFVHLLPILMKFLTKETKNDWLKLNPMIVNPKKFQFRFISEKRNALPGRLTLPIRKEERKLTLNFLLSHFHEVW